MTKWISKIPQTVARTREELSKVVENATARVEAEAKFRAPVDTGDMRDSIQWVMESDLTGVVFVGAEYGIYVEMGTTRMRAQPYLLPALEEVARGLGAEIQRTILK